MNNILKLIFDAYGSIFSVFLAKNHDDFTKKIIESVNVSNKIMIAVEKEILTFSKFEKVYSNDIKNIKSAHYVMPKLGSKSLGKMVVIYKKPVLKYA